ncbi:hypothetical protein KOI40_03370 [Aestuariicella sp. G3-2]|uniref:hypothetical protein n=1 Tax=Pseudomaricurvus albidus TaxID=2842452 RepID=UPI001C0E56AA|nr:hypothetical protein [Aestuariicella albida]MBU3068843.1 hypothetical protein [Aestuariicella albida]
MEEKIAHYYNNSDAVFFALITDSKIEGDPSGFSAVNNRFHVIHQYRGNPSQWEVLTTEGSNGTSCATRLITGGRYLFFLNYNHINHCSWFIPIGGPYDDKKYRHIMEKVVALERLNLDSEE